VIDGDTVEMAGLGKVRLIGVDTPERGRCFEDAATAFTRERLEGRLVEYELGEDGTDRYDRTLAYLSREGRMHNLALLSEGYAKVLTIAPNDKYAPRFARAERGAERADAGLWGACARGERESVSGRAPARTPGEGAGERGGGGGSAGSPGCLTQAACPGRRDGDGDGCYCE